MVEVSRIAKENGSRPVLTGKKLINTVLYNLFIVKKYFASEIILNRSLPVDNCPENNCPLWELSGINCPGGN